MTIKALYPNVRPALDLNFARTKALDPRITYTRASTGTFVGSNGLIQTAASGVARFDHDGATGESLGLLVEEARTNLRTLSTDFSSGFFNSTFNVTATPGQVSPAGDSSASLITLNAGTFAAKLTERFFPNGNVYARSWFVKKTNQRYIWCGDQNNGNYAPNYRFDLDLVTGTVVSGGGFNAGFAITAHTNGYYRISVVCVSQDNFFISANNTTSVNPLSQASAHDGTETFVIWGYQIEQASFSTSYIPTSGSTVTRAADVASVPATGWIDTTGGTILAEYYKRIAIQGSGNYIWSLGDGNPMIMDGWKAELDFAAGIMNTTGPVVTGKNKIIFKFEQGNYAISANGSAVSTSTLGNAWSSAPSSLRIATGSAVPFGAKGLHAPIARLTYYPTRLPDAQLIALTQ
jgi:hypothetical protein